jgi:hypothetical protein
MTHRTRLTAASAAVIMILSAPMATAQDRPISGGSSGGVQGSGVSASTYGQGTTDGSSLGVTGGGEATAVDGRAGTRSSARLNDRRAMQRSTAYARTDDEMARSRTRTVVRNGEDVRSRTTSMYRDRDGGPPVRTSECTRATAEGVVTTDCRGPN